MARNSRPASNGKAAADDKTAKVDKAAKMKKGGRPNHRRRGSKPAESTSSAPLNPTIQSMSVETPIGASRSYVFPSDSAAMQSFGNYTTTPGQENFITEFNFIDSLPNSEFPFPGYEILCDMRAKRSANAMVIGVCPYFGVVESRTRGATGSPLQMAALNLKQFIDTSFGTNTSYDTQDLMLYLMAVSAVFPMITEIKRDLRLALTYVVNQYPQFIPKGLFAALGIADDQHQYENGEGALYTAKHLRSFVDQLNQLIIAFNRLPMPPEIGAFNYNQDIFEPIFMDTEDIQTAQLYVFRNEHYWIYDEEGTSSRPGPLLINTTLNLGASVQRKLEILADQIARISALRTSSTAMLQNLYNAYGSRDTVQVATLDINAIDQVPFVYDPNILTMIENMNVCKFISISEISADHENGQMIGNVVLTMPENHEWMRQAVNVPLQFHKPWNSVTHDDIGWALRMRPMFNTSKVPDGFGTPQSRQALCADEYVGFAIPTSASIAVINSEGNIYTYFGWRGRTPAEGQPGWYDIARDFKAAPIEVTGYWEEVGRKWRCTGYTANRDVEVTYRLEDIRMHWVYMTISLWAANVNRNAKGTRTRDAQI